MVLKDQWGREVKVTDRRSVVAEQAYERQPGGFVPFVPTGTAPVPVPGPGVRQLARQLLEARKRYTTGLRGLFSEDTARQIVSAHALGARARFKVDGPETGSGLAGRTDLPDFSDPRQMSVERRAQFYANRWDATRRRPRR